MTQRTIQCKCEDCWAIFWMTSMQEARLPDHNGYTFRCPVCGGKVQVIDANPPQILGIDKLIDRQNLNMAATPVTPEPLPPYNSNARCPKCGTGKDEGEIRTRWCEGEHMTEIRMNAWGTRTLRCPAGEHFHRTCSTCGYEWLEAVAK